MRRKKERSKQGQTNKQTNKAKQHSTPKAVNMYDRIYSLPSIPWGYMYICSTCLYVNVGKMSPTHHLPPGKIPV